MERFKTFIKVFTGDSQASQSSAVKNESNRYLLFLQNICQIAESHGSAEQYNLLVSPLLGALDALLGLSFNTSKLWILFRVWNSNSSWGKSPNSSHQNFPLFSVEKTTYVLCRMCRSAKNYKIILQICHITPLCLN